MQPLVSAPYFLIRVLTLSTHNILDDISLANSTVNQHSIQCYVLAVLSGTTVCTGCKRFSHSSLKSEMHCVLSVQYTTYFPTDEGRSIVVPGLPRRAGTPGA